jgi:hypothetical protein
MTIHERKPNFLMYFVLNGYWWFSTDCGSLSTVISNGKASQSGTLFEDTTVYTCNTGHYISQGVVTQTVTCLDTGKWNGTAVKCIPVGKRTICVFEIWL